nr:hypothetical protein [Tanacetum cinerariifolium]
MLRKGKPIPLFTKIMGIHDFLCLPEWTGAEVLPVSNPSAKVIAKAEVSQKRKAFTSSSASGHVAKCTRSVVTQSFGSTTHPNLFADDSTAKSDDDDDDDDAYYEILIVTPTCSAYGKGTMTDADAVVAQSIGASCLRVSFEPVPSFREFSRDAIHRDFFPFSPAYFVCKTVVDQFLKPREMVWIKALSSDQLTAKISVLYCLMMSHGGKKKIISLTKSLDNLHAEVARLFADLNRVTGQFQDLVHEFLSSDEFSRFQAEFLSFTASAGFEHGLSMHRTKEEFVDVLKKIYQFVPRAHDRLVEASPLVAQTDYAFLNKISKHVAEPFSIILQLELETLAYNKMVNGAANAKPENVFLQGASHVVDDATELTVTRLEHVSFGPGDVVVALSAREKGDGSTPSSTLKRGGARGMPNNTCFSELGAN